MSTNLREPASYTDWDAVPLALTVAQVCELAGLSRETVYKLLNSGRLRSTKIGARRVISKTAVRELLEGP
jgi:excisionase family DNA binding protein